MRALLLVGGGILIGVGVSWAEATRAAELKANQRLDEEWESMTRISMMTRKLISEMPADTEEDLAKMDEADTSADAIKVGGEIIQETAFRETALSDVTPSVDYLKNVQEYWDPNATDVVTRVEYITEADFEEDDGRAKEQILIHMGGDGEPLFINEGIMVVDWDEIIPNTILADMYTKCPPGEDKVLYVRNHANDTDYEITQEIP